MAGRSCPSLKPKMKLEGEDSVLGEARTGVVGTSPSANLSSSPNTMRRQQLWGWRMLVSFTSYNHLFLLSNSFLPAPPEVENDGEVRK